MMFLFKQFNDEKSLKLVKPELNGFNYKGEKIC
jgi:hypothetical protein